MRINLPFETIPAWAARALDRKSALRTRSPHARRSPRKARPQPRQRLPRPQEQFGRAHWDETLNYIRLGLGQRIDDVVTWADPGGGNIGLPQARRPRPPHLLVAALGRDALLPRLRRPLPPPHDEALARCAFDEPDLHLHPGCSRVLGMFETMARDCPVILATHSDRLLDGLSDPGEVRGPLPARRARRHAAGPGRTPRRWRKWLDRFPGPRGHPQRGARAASRAHEGGVELTTGGSDRPLRGTSATKFAAGLQPARSGEGLRVRRDRRRAAPGGGDARGRATPLKGVEKLLRACREDSIVIAADEGAASSPSWTTTSSARSCAYPATHRHRQVEQAIKTSCNAQERLFVALLKQNTESVIEENRLPATC